MTYSQKYQTSDLYNDYPVYKETRIDNKRFRHEDILPVIEKLKKDSLYAVEKAGESIEGRDIFMIKAGTGETKIFAWSQMHGDESTATMALFDVFNFLSADDGFNGLRKSILENVTIYFIPMLNPDGAEKFRRRNALGVDLNRDALRLQNPESRILKGVSDSLKPEFGFNLHDQNTRYTAGRTYRPATISFLAPAYNYEKEINSVRENTMKVIAEIYGEISRIIPGHIGRYNDDFEPRAFGDNFVKWGTSSVLIESGGWENDVQKQFIRKVNFIALLTGFRAIAEGYYKNADIETYRSIPENDDLLFDLKLTELTVDFNGKNYLLDFGINYDERSSDEDIFFRGGVADIGDLSIYHGYEEIDCSGLKAASGKVWPEPFNSIEEIENLDFSKLYEEGYIAVRLKGQKPGRRYTQLPIVILTEEAEFKSEASLYSAPNFLIKKGDEVKYAVINGFVYDLIEGGNGYGNGIIL